MKLNSFQALMQSSLNDKTGGGVSEIKTPYCKERFEEFREGSLKDIHALKVLDRYPKDFLSKPVGTKMVPNESLSFSVEAILKRPAPAMNRAFH